VDWIVEEAGHVAHKVEPKFWRCCDKQTWRKEMTWKTKLWVRRLY